MTRLAHLHRAPSTFAGLSRLRGARGGEGGGAARRSPTTSTSTRSPGARSSLREAIAAKFERLYGVPRRPRARDHGHLRVHRGHDRDAARGAGPGRRGDRRSSPSTRTTAPTPSSPGAVPRFVQPAPAGLELRSRRAARARSRTRRAPSSSTRRTTRRARSSRARSCESIAGPVPEHDARRHHRRDLRAHPLRRRRARADGDAARHGRRARSPSTA